MILSLGLLADDCNQSCTFATLPVWVTLGLLASTSNWLATPGAIVLAERADRQDYCLIERLRLDIHRVPDAVMAGERNSVGTGWHEERISQ